MQAAVFRRSGGRGAEVGLDEFVVGDSHGSGLHAKRFPDIGPHVFAEPSAVVRGLDHLAGPVDTTAVGPALTGLEGEWAVVRFSLQRDLVKSGKETKILKSVQGYPPG